MPPIATAQVISARPGKACNPTSSQPSATPAGRAAASQPISPFGTPRRRTDARPGLIVLSDGRSLPGWIYTTRDQPLRLYLPSERRYHQVPLGALKRIDAIVQQQRYQQLWRWKQPGSDEKLFRPGCYPLRKMAYRLTLADGRTIEGELTAPLWLERAGRTRRFVLHKRQRGPVGSSLEQLVFVRQVIFSLQAMHEAVGQSQPTTRRARSPRPDVPTSHSRSTTQGT